MNDRIQHEGGRKRIRGVELWPDPNLSLWEKMERDRLGFIARMKECGIDVGPKGRAMLKKRGGFPAL